MKTLLLALGVVLLPITSSLAAKGDTTFETPEVKVTFRVANDWNSGFQGDVVIKNKTTKTLKNWQLSFRMDRTLTSTWSATMVEKSGSLYRFNAAAYSWNRDIPAQGSVNFGFLGYAGRVTQPPTGFAFSPSGTPAATPTPSATPKPTATPTPTPTLDTFSIQDATIEEPVAGSVVVNVDVTIKRSSGRVVGVAYQSKDGTAKAGSDYETALGNLLFEPGVTKKSIPVTILSNALTEGTEKFTMELTAAEGATIDRKAATVTITEPVTGPATGPQIPFGSQLQPYASGTLRPSASQASMDQTVISYYEKWKDAYFVSVGTTGWKAVYSDDAEYPFVAEAQGYGLEVFALMAGADPEAQASFDALLKYVLAHPSKINSSLMAAEQNKSGVSVGGSDSATDGDLAIAYGLLLADRQWGSAGSYNYKSLAITRINAIKKSEINPTTQLPLLGDWASPSDSYYYGTRPSDFMVDHFRAFKAATGDAFWDSVVTATQNLVTHLQKNYAATTGLVPDFVVSTNTTNPKPAPANYLEGSDDGRYSYNATRVPWRLGADAAIFGDATSKTQAQKITAWIKSTTGGSPDKIKSGYTLDGKVLGNYSDIIFTAPFAPAAMHASENQAWLDALWTAMAKEAAKSALTDYYGASILLQNMIVTSGNYWSPAK